MLYVLCRGFVYCRALDCLVLIGDFVVECILNVLPGLSLFLLVFICIFAVWLLSFLFKFVIHPSRPSVLISFLKPFQVLAGDTSSGPLGHFTFLYGHKKYNRGNGRKGTKNKRTIWAWINSKCKKGEFVTLHSLCIC